MNYGMINNQRPSKGSSRCSSSGLSLPTIAKQLGLPVESLGQEAENMWRMLDDLAASDPQEYQKFIQAQYKAAAEEEARSEDGSSAKKKGEFKSFVPSVGFVIKTVESRRHNHVKMFLNCTSHEAIEIPKSCSNVPVPRETRELQNTSNLQIPLVIGPLRSIAPNESSESGAFYAHDVVFHPWVLERCAWDAHFKKDVVNLAMKWVQSDHGYSLSIPGKLIKSLYKGGKKDPNTHQVQAVPFYVTRDETEKSPEDEPSKIPVKPTPATLSNESSPSSSVSTTMKDPSALLQHINRDQMANHHNIQEKESQTSSLKTLSVGRPTPTQPTKKKLIEVLHEEDDSTHLLSDKNETKTSAVPSHVSNPSTRHIQVKKSTVMGGVKKGFLVQSTKQQPLYPSGSSEGRPPSAYVKLMEKSKVVDLSHMSPEEAQVAMKVHGKSNDERDFDGTSSRTKKDSSSSRVHRQGNSHALNYTSDTKDHGDMEFEKLCMEADADYRSATIVDSDHPANFDSQFQRFTHLFQKLA